MNKSKGILVLAVNHPNFGQMAFNFAISVKIRNPDIKICLVHDSKSMGTLDAKQKTAFDDFFQIDENFYKFINKTAIGRAKCRLNEIKPYDINIFVDVDSLCLSPDFFLNLFNKTEEYHFLIPHFGAMYTDDIQKNGVTHWLSWGDVKLFFGSEVKPGIIIPEAIQSSVICYDNSELSDSIFKKALYAHDKFYNAGTANKMWYGTVPDELCFWTAMGLAGHQPAYNFENQIYFIYNAKNTNIRSEILNNYGIVTFPSAGSGLRQFQKDIYNDFVNHNARNWGYRTPYLWKDKSSFFAKEYNDRGRR